jgi:hypothetical protein
MPRSAPSTSSCVGGASEAEGGNDATLTALRAVALAGDLARDATAEAVPLHGAYA